MAPITWTLIGHQMIRGVLWYSPKSKFPSALKLDLWHVFGDYKLLKLVPHLPVLMSLSGIMIRYPFSSSNIAACLFPDTDHFIISQFSPNCSQKTPVVHPWGNWIKCQNFSKPDCHWVSDLVFGNWNVMHFWKLDWHSRHIRCTSGNWDCHWVSDILPETGFK